MYAIIDVETTGLNARTEKITEIAILIHDGENVIDEYSTLVNPGKRISYHITSLTGINNKMVADAPGFHEIAKELVQLTDGKTIVGHNVNFDYGFLRHEFKRLGYEFSRKTLCTCKMSKKAFPLRKSYSLGKLCKELGIPNEARHRALGDAKATSELFGMIRAIDKDMLKSSFKGLNTCMGKSVTDSLPEEAGVYYFHNKAGEIIYVGKSTNIKSRVLSHLSNNLSGKAIDMREETCDVSYEITGSELIALLLESEEIKTKMPLYNKAQRRTLHNWGLYSFTDDNGYIRLKIMRIIEEALPVNSYYSKTEAREHLFQLAEKYHLCQKLCGLYVTSGSCFQYQIKECYGACLGAEPANMYNQRVEEALDGFAFPSASFYIIDKGRNSEERSVVKIEHGKYIGFGFFCANNGAVTTDIFDDAVKPHLDNKDVKQIIRSYLNRNQVEKIIEF